MFYNCESLISLPDISKWNSDNLKGTVVMFDKCISLKSKLRIQRINGKCKYKIIFY